MKQLITTPILLEESIGDFQLRFSEISIRQAALNNFTPEERLDVIQGFLAIPGPLVSVSAPQWWNLSPYIRKHAGKYPNAPGLPDLISVLRENEVYLVKVGCAFHPDVEKPIKSAWFSGYFRPQFGKNEITVLDILPRDLDSTGMMRGSIRWALSTRLAFSSMAITPDERLLEIEFRSLIPTITGEMGKITTPGWHYESHEIEGLVDSRYGYYLIQKPRLARQVLLRQELTVQVQTSLGLLTADFKDKDRPRLSHTICSEWIEV